MNIEATLPIRKTAGAKNAPAVPRATAATFRPRGRAELTCLYCGRALGEVRVRRGRRPTNAELRAAYAATPDVLAPAWDAHGAPRCPRCAARLFVELSDQRLRVDVIASS